MPVPVLLSLCSHPCAPVPLPCVPPCAPPVLCSPCPCAPTPQLATERSVRLLVIVPPPPSIHTHTHPAAAPHTTKKGDFNDANVILDASGGTRVGGVIDFGDAVRTGFSTVAWQSYSGAL
eukprot:SAG11_NODE_5767_length_1467_cov_1.316520_2_plen_120_part_00